MPSNSATFSFSALSNFCSPGKRTSWAIIAVAICIAVGNVSFEDWPMLQWSFGCTGSFDPMVPPMISMARFAITSFAFILDCVPDPVCHTTSGKLSSNLPENTSVAAWIIASARSASNLPEALFASAQAFLIAPSARTMLTGCFSQPIGKFRIDLWV